MNKLGFGFLRLPKAGEEYDWALIDRMVDRFMDRGGRYFDTCYTYLNGMSEEGIRRAVAARKPRESFELADKLPGYDCRSLADCEQYFTEELKRCGVDYFDVYLLHGLNGENYRIAEEVGEFQFIREKKQQGKARRIGFSYHDNAALLEEILTAHPEVDVVQLQINYLDWDTAGIESGACYETCLRHGKKVLVMEPVKGGILASLPEEAERRLRALHPDWSPAGWAIRFVQSLPGVEICLSGMNTPEQLEDNLSAAESLTQEEIEVLFSLRELIHGENAVSCTGCRYCEPHCPKKIAIPDYFKMFNEIRRYPQDDWKIRASYEQRTLSRGRASACLGCGSCERYCPQRLPIRELLKAAAGALEAED